jgi:hypothetical protein
MYHRIYSPHVPTINSGHIIGAYGTPPVPIHLNEIEVQVQTAQDQPPTSQRANIAWAEIWIDSCTANLMDWCKVSINTSPERESCLPPSSSIDIQYHFAESVALLPSPGLVPTLMRYNPLLVSPLIPPFDIMCCPARYVYALILL